MKLRTLYPRLSTAERKALAEAVGIGESYLWQIHKRWRGKRASLALMEKLAAADKRLTMPSMVAEFTEPWQA